MKTLGVNRLSIISAQTADKEYLRSVRDKEIQELNRLRLRAADQEIRLCLEPHILTSFCYVDAIREIVQQHPEFLITFDPSHFLHTGEKIQDIEFIAQHTDLVHLRDARKGKMFVPYGDGELNVSYCIEKLAEAGYSGPIAMEFMIDRPDDELIENLTKFRMEVEKCIAACRKNEK